MRYIVTHEAGIGAAIDIGAKPTSFDLEGALHHACRLMSEGKSNVTIRDDGGHHISGEALARCCRGEMSLTPDLHSVS